MKPHFRVCHEFHVEAIASSDKASAVKRSNESKEVWSVLSMWGKTSRRLNTSSTVRYLRFEIYGKNRFGKFTFSRRLPKFA